jgi:ParB family chromosome partitioning protein
MIALARPNNIVEFPQKSNEWYTPARYIEAARTVMGGIDLDPASCELANQTIKATRYYSKEDNGLQHTWHGRIWLNPPFGRVHPELKGSTKSYQLYFMHTLLEKHQSGEIEQAIALVFGTSACMPWFQPFWQFPICIAKSRIEFDKPDGSKDHFGYGNMFVYLGPYELLFIDVFGQFGTIAKRVSQPKVQYVNLSLWETLK